jgi:hypothetical protein
MNEREALRATAALTVLATDFMRGNCIEILSQCKRHPCLVTVSAWVIPAELSVVWQGIQHFDPIAPVDDDWHSKGEEALDLTFAGEFHLGGDVSEHWRDVNRVQGRLLELILREGLAIRRLLVHAPLSHC